MKLDKNQRATFWCVADLCCEKVEMTSLLSCWSNCMQLYCGPKAFFFYKVLLKSKKKKGKGEVFIIHGDWNQMSLLWSLVKVNKASLISMWWWDISISDESESTSVRAVEELVGQGSRRAGVCVYECVRGWGCVCGHRDLTVSMRTPKGLYII